MGQLEDALQCALTYLLFHEGEEFVSENVAYYRETLEHDGEPREVSICYCLEGLKCKSSRMLKSVITKAYRKIEEWLLEAAFRSPCETTTFAMASYTLNLP